MASEGNIRALLEGQRAYFESGRTLPVSARIQALEGLERAILNHEEELYRALKADLGKSRTESYLCEVGLTLSELRYVKKHVRAWSRKKWILPSPAQLPGRCFTMPEPYGVVLILSPWNYPVLLTLEPLIGALAAGNCAVVKPSAYSPRVSAVLAELLSSAFPPEHVCTVEGGRRENQALLEQKFDYIFFTGSPAVGREVMARAAAHLTPVTLELGGKSPCIVDKTADWKLAARRIVFGKFLNCGQTCVAPDYLLVERPVKEKLVEEMAREITCMYGVRPLDSPDYGRIVNEKHFARLSRLLEGTHPAVGGEADPEGLRIAPTLLDGVSGEEPVMQEEIFGPILPILTVDSMEEAVAFVRKRPRPLALYLFTRSRETEKRVLTALSFGGGCVNDTVLHLASSRLPFGGVGNSGMGSYHGRESFSTFSHRKSILKTPGRPSVPLRAPPDTPGKARWIRRLRKWRPAHPPIPAAPSRKEFFGKFSDSS